MVFLVKAARAGNTKYCPPVSPPAGFVNLNQAIQAQNQTQTQNSSAVSGPSLSSSVATGGTSNSQAVGGAGGTANQTQSASNQGNNQTSIATYKTYYPRQTPPAFSGNVEPTIPCANARNAGASSPIIGLSVGFSTENHECDLREDARLFYEFGQPQLAVRLLCKDAKKFGLKNCQFNNPPVPVVIVARNPVPHKNKDKNYVTQQELHTVESRMTKKLLDK